MSSAKYNPLGPPPTMPIFIGNHLTLRAAHARIARVIRSFRDKETENLFQRERSRKLPPTLQQAALRKLRMLNNAATLEDLRVPPANHLEKLGGDRAGQHSIRINDQWRLCFEWRESDAYQVEITDYH